MSRSTTMQIVVTLSIGWGAFTTAQFPHPISIGLFAAGCVVALCAIAEDIKEHITQTKEDR